MQQGNQEFDPRIVSGEKLFNMLIKSFFRCEGERTPEAIAVFHELPGVLLDLLQGHQVRAYHEEPDVSYIGVFTCRVPSDDSVSDVYYRVGDLRDAFSKTIDSTSPQAGQTLLDVFKKYVEKAISRSKVPEGLQALDGYGDGVAHLKREDKPEERRWSFAPSRAV